MKALRKSNRDGSEQVLLGKVIWREKPARKRFRRDDWKFSIETLRLREIEAIIRHRHGNGIPDPTGTDDVDSCLCYLRAVALTPGVQDLASWAAVWAPWADPVTVTTISALGIGRKKMIRADAVAKLLFVVMAERTSLSLKTIGASDISADGRKSMAKASKRERDRNRQQDLRRAAGVQDRASYVAVSLSRLKPWEAEGISRRTWERRRVASPSRVDIYTIGDTPASKPEKSLTFPKTRSGQDRVAGLVVGLGDHHPAELQEAAPHGSSDMQEGAAA